MKISSKVKEQTRIRLLEAAVDVITEKGFEKATMRSIAKRADVADATIYNYFPSKEKLLYGYCEYIQLKVMNSIQSIEDFHEYSLQEQLWCCGHCPDVCPGRWHKGFRRNFL